LIDDFGPFAMNFSIIENRQFRKPQITRNLFINEKYDHMTIHVTLINSYGDDYISDGDIFILFFISEIGGEREDEWWMVCFLAIRWM